jgi:hypothetical protein
MAADAKGAGDGREDEVLMAWFKVEDAFDDRADTMHREDAIGLFICMGTWCSRNISDGIIPKNRAKTLPAFSKKRIEILKEDRGVLGGPWILEDDHHYIIRTFLKFNPSREQVEATREATKRRVGLYRSGNAHVTPLQEKSNADCNGVSNTAPDPDPDPVLDICADKGGKGTRRFTKPSVSEVETHMRDRSKISAHDCPKEAEKFWNHHESKGWVIGRSPMKSWRAAVVTWEGNYRPTPEPTGGEGWKPYVKPEYN